MRMKRASFFFKRTLFSALIFDLFCVFFLTLAAGKKCQGAKKCEPRPLCVPDEGLIVRENLHATDETPAHQFYNETTEIRGHVLKRNKTFDRMHSES